MADMQQCGLCLSCGVPFMPSADDTDLFRHTGNLSILFLNVEFKNNQTIRRQYQTAKFSSDRQYSHVFHESHHAPALIYMCNHHTDDSDLAWPVPVVPPLPGGVVLPLAPNGPLPYFRAPTSKKKRGPHAATWARPDQAERLDFSPLLDHVVQAAGLPTARAAQQNLSEKFAICRACNSIMTQRNDMAYHLGLSTMREENPTPLIAGPNRPIVQQVTDDHGAESDNAYGVWTRGRGAGYHGPQGKGADDLTPAVGYYLHMCLPFIDTAHPDPFAGIADANLMAGARRIYLELCWLILEIACVATLRDKGKLYNPKGERSHGPHQHAGVLDFYVSYFLFRLFQFEFGVDSDREGVDFIQWHQKYYSDALNCKALFANTDTMGGLLASTVYTSTNQSSRALVQDICQGLVRLYTQDLRNMVQFVRGPLLHVGLPPGVRAYFLPLPAMRELRRRSSFRVRRCFAHVFTFFTGWFHNQNPQKQVVPHDFESALRAFGASALLSRSIQLCRDCPPEFRAQLNDFRQSWQWIEIDNIRKNDKHLTLRSAHTTYLLCSLLEPPVVMPGEKSSSIDDLWQADFCSPWTAVIPLESVGALEVDPPAAA